jgi:prolyl 4-hydroxylase
MNDSPMLFTIPDFLTATACELEIARAEAIGFAPAPVTTRLGFVMMPEVRNNTRVMLDDTAHAATLFTRLAPFMRGRGSPIGLNERLRFYKYDPTQCFRWHRDGSFRRANGEASALTFMIYLNDDFAGGETEFESAPSIRPRRGMALVFSHRLRHQGAPVLRGKKYVLRSDVMFAVQSQVEVGSAG